MPDKLYHECCEVISQGRAILEDLQQWGFEHVCEGENVAQDTGTISSAAGVAAQQDRSDALSELETSMHGCTLCPLCEKRKQIVFGVGNPQADIVLVGEAPGREEDEKGFPFVGEAGRLLDRILFAMKLSRQDVYICNVIKCRPPNNRDPEPDEITACEQFLKQQLTVIRPQLIIALGRFASQALLQSSAPIGRLRGHWHEYQGIPLMPTFHPAYLLRNPSGKREVWEDMKQVMHRLQQ